MRIRPLPILLLLTALPVFADNVYLANGRKFEGVMAETTGTQVRIQIQGGVLVLPKSQVLQVEAGDSNLGEFLQRKESLKRSPATRAADWVELARWAHSKQLDQAARESALAAAVLDPHAPGLAPILRGFGYALDEQLDRWVRYDDLMRRKGFVQASNGQWISQEEFQARARAQAEDTAQRRPDRQEQARAAREDRLAVLTELALTNALAQPQVPYVGPYAPWGEPVILLPGFVTSPRGRHNQRSPDLFHLEPDFGSSDFVRIPGSLIQGRLPGSHR